MSNISKIAYPNTGSGEPQPKYDINKWLSSMRDIYIKSQQPNSNMSLAIDHVTSGWNNKEKYDFLSWMHFYQENSHNKYKTAAMDNKKLAFNVPPQIGNYNLPLESLRSYLPSANEDKPAEIPTKLQARTDIEKREIIETQRKKLLGRLNSAEKLLLSNDGIQFAGDELNDLLKTIHELKIKILNANKLSVMSSLFEDLIIKSANIAAINGLKKSASVLYKIANTQQILPHTPPQPTQTNPINNTIQPENNQNELDPSNIFDEEDDSPYKLFLDGMGGIDTNDSSDSSNEDDDASIVVEAQMTHTPTRQPQQIQPRIQNTNQRTDNIEVSSSDIDDRFEHAFKDIKISDVIERLESLSSIFKKREIARQISIVDIMMGELGISSFFPGLGEAQKSALESNQYCSTRIEDILSKLRGTQIGEQINLEGDDDVASAEVEALKSKLENEKIMEDARKQNRKQMENAKVDSRIDRENKAVTEIDSATPAIEVSEPVTPISAPTNTQIQPAPLQPTPAIQSQNRI